MGFSLKIDYMLMRFFSSLAGEEGPRIPGFKD
jgi:hypothetical protein